MINQRIGVVTADKPEFEKITSVFPDSYFHYGADVLEFYQKIGSQKPDFVIFHKLEQEKENGLWKSIRYLRQKQEFKKTPILVLFESEKLCLPFPLQDRLVRAFQLGNQLFLKVVDFVVSAKTVEKLEQPLTLPEGSLEGSFGAAAQKRMGISQNFKVHGASDEEIHARFLFQKDLEIATSLFWVRFNARILEEGNPAFMKMLENFTEEEREQMASRILGHIMDDLAKQIGETLEKVGAVRFKSSDELEFEDRKPFVKAAKNRAEIFRSDECCLLLQITQYI